MVTSWTWQRRVKWRLAVSTAWVLLPLDHAGLRLLGYKRLSALLLRVSPQPDSAPLSPERALGRARTTGRVVNTAAARSLYRVSCLERSLVTWWLLRWQRIPCELRVGVRKEAATITAHAWVEYGGAVINDQADVVRLYAPFRDGISPEKITRWS
jgi:hypothetical protein